MSEYSILLEIRDYHANKICEKGIDIIKSLGHDSMLSGDDSGLENVWDEICVLVQSEQSNFREAYENTIEQIIKSIFKNTDEEILKLISIMDDDEFELTVEKDFSYTKYQFNEDAACKIVKQKVLMEAGNYTNERIEKYIGNNS